MGRGRHAGFSHSKETRNKIGEVMRARAAVRKMAKLLKVPEAIVAEAAAYCHAENPVRCQKCRKNGISKKLQTSVAK